MADPGEADPPSAAPPEKPAWPPGRPPDRLPDTALVVRGGIADGVKFRKSVKANPDGPVGFSVYSWPEADVETLARGGDVPHGQVGVTTVGQIRALGHDVITTTGMPGTLYHATVAVAQPFNDEAAAALASLFKGRHNPYEKARP